MITRQFQDLRLSGPGLGMMRLPVLDGDDGRVDEEVCPQQIKIFEMMADFTAMIGM